MTGRLLTLAASAAVLLTAAPAAAHGHGPVGQAGPALDPCVLGTGVPGQCLGPVRVTQEVSVTAAGPQMAPPMAMAAPPQAWTASAAPVAMMPAPMSSGPAPQPMMMAAASVSAPVGAGCTPQMIAQRVPCNGQWVYAQQPAPAPQVTYTPPPMVAPAPVVVPAMAASTAGPIPLSFFTGGIQYGVGYPTQTSYTYGGGGFAIVGGGTRFSGVRERSPFPLVPPQRHRPPPPRPHCPGHCGY